MKHFYSFLKRKGLFIETEGKRSDNATAVHMFNHELMEVGYVLTGTLFRALAVQSLKFITSVRNEVLENINKLTPKQGGVIIYRNFPNEVPDFNYNGTMVGVMNYLTSGLLTDIGTHVPSGFSFEPKKLKKIDLITKTEFESIFTDLLYSASSISKSDKDILDYFIDNGYPFDFSKITFNETKAYVGKRLMENKTLNILPVKSATTLLRIYASYSGGDEGLKENTKFKKPSKSLVRLLANTLDKSYDLEESFKLYREVWLKVLFYLNPLSANMKKKYPNLAKYADLVRNSPKTLKTFNSYVETGLKDKDIKVLDLLKTRPGAFARRLDHCVRVFGVKAVKAFTQTNSKLGSLVDVYNHFSNRNVASQRNAVLASGSASNLVSYGALEALPEKLVNSIKEELMGKLNTVKNPTLVDKKVYIDQKLYFRNLVSNNRASNQSLSGANGTLEILENDVKTLRLFTQWYSSDDIDLSSFAITGDGRVTKVGFAGITNFANGAILYSGDNTGHSRTKNDEYIDINIESLPSDVEWVICESRVYRGNNYNTFNGGSPVTGWMNLTNAKSNKVLQTDSLGNSMKLTANTKNAYTIAYNVHKNCVVYLDVAKGNGSVTDEKDVLSVVEYLRSITSFNLDSNEIDWSRINQGHILNLVSTTVVDDPKDADVVFDENTTFEEVAKYL